MSGNGYEYSYEQTGSSAGNQRSSESNIASDLLAFSSGANRQSQNIATDLLALLGGGSASASGAETRSSASYSMASSGGVSDGVNFLSKIEQAILRSTNPIDVNETEELTVLGQHGLWINRSEVQAWRGDISINEYRIHEDSNPQVINKRVQQSIEYVQELAIRYLRPPTPPSAGEIIITQESNFNTNPAPPLIIRQAAARAATPEPMVIREAPPKAPTPVGPKRITISGKRNPPPPRKVVIERLAPLPSKPQNVIVERWLPYSETKRRVIFNRAVEVKAEVATPRNVIVQWESPSVNIRQEIKYLGVIKANPAEYVQRYGSSLKIHTDLPQFVLDIATPSEVGVLAANYRYKSVLELEGNLEGFQYVNLDTEGMTEYRAQLVAKGIRDLGASANSRSMSSASARYSSAGSSSYSAVAGAALQIFSMIDVDGSGSITVEEAEKIVLRLNSQLKRSYGEVEVRAFFSAFGSENISREQFVSVFEKLAA